MLGLHIMTVYAKADRGKLLGMIRLGPKSIRFRESAIKHWLKDRGIRGSGFYDSTILLERVSGINSLISLNPSRRS